MCRVESSTVGFGALGLRLKSKVKFKLAYLFALAFFLKLVVELIAAHRVCFELRYDR